VGLDDAVKIYAAAGKHIKMNVSLGT